MPWGWGNGRLKILGCEAATICGGRPDFFPGQRRRSRRASTEWLDGEAGEWRGAGCQMVVCDRPCADLVLKRPCVSLAWVVAVAFLNVQARTVARTVSPYRARVGCDRGGEDDARNFCRSRRFER